MKLDIRARLVVYVFAISLFCFYAFTQISSKRTSTARGMLDFIPSSVDGNFAFECEKYNWSRLQFLWRLKSKESLRYRIRYFSGRLPKDQFEIPRTFIELGAIELAPGFSNSLTMNVIDSHLGPKSIAICFREKIFISADASWKNSATNVEKTLYLAGLTKEFSVSKNKPVIFVRYWEESSEGAMVWLEPISEESENINSSPG